MSSASSRHAPRAPNPTTKMRRAARQTGGRQARADDRQAGAATVALRTCRDRTRQRTARRSDVQRSERRSADRGHHAEAVARAVVPGIPRRLLGQRARQRWPSPRSRSTRRQAAQRARRSKCARGSRRVISTRKPHRRRLLRLRQPHRGEGAGRCAAASATIAASSPARRTSTAAGKSGADRVGQGCRRPRIAEAATGVWVTRHGELWFAQDNDDRVDLLPEEEALRPAEDRRSCSCGHALPLGHRAGGHQARRHHGHAW